MTDKYLTLKELAELAGIKPSTLSAYRARGEAGVPEPDLTVGGRPAWHISTGRQWAEERQDNG